MEINLIIELGGSYLSIYKKNSGLIFKEPSILAVCQNGEKYEIKGFGENALVLASIEDPSLNIFSPIGNGKIKSFEYANILLSLSLKKAGLKPKLISYKAAIIVGTGFSSEDKEDYDKLLRTNGIEPVYYIPSVFGIAISNGLDEFSNKNILAVDIGSQKTDVAILSGDGILLGSSITLGGKAMTTGVMNMIEDKYNLVVSLFTSEKVKEELASLITYDNSTIDVKGIDKDSKEERVVTIKAEDVREVLLVYFKEILKQVHSVLNACSDEVLKQIKMNGFVLGGQVCKATGIESFFKENLYIQGAVVNEVEDAPILGIAKIIKNKTFLHKIAYQL